MNERNKLILKNFAPDGSRQSDLHVTFDDIQGYTAETGGPTPSRGVVNDALRDDMIDGKNKLAALFTMDNLVTVALIGGAAVAIVCAPALAPGLVALALHNLYFRVVKRSHDYLSSRDGLMTGAVVALGATAMSGGHLALGAATIVGATVMTSSTFKQLHSDGVSLLTAVWDVIVTSLPLLIIGCLTMMVVRYRKRFTSARHSTSRSVYQRRRLQLAE